MNEVMGAMMVGPIDVSVAAWVRHRGGQMPAGGSKQWRSAYRSWANATFQEHQRHACSVSAKDFAQILDGLGVRWRG